MNNYRKRKVILLVTSLAIVAISMVVYSSVFQNFGMIEMPGFMVTDFEGIYINNQDIQNKSYAQYLLNKDYYDTKFELVETIEYSLSRDNPFQTYTGTNYHSGVVLSFIDIPVPLKYTMIAPNSKGQIQTVSNPFPVSANCSSIAYYLPLKYDSDYEFTYGLDLEAIDGIVNENEAGAPLPNSPPNLNAYYLSRTTEIVNRAQQKEIVKPILGTVNVYKIVK